MYCIIVEVKQFLYRPIQALRVPGGWGSQSAHEGGKVDNPTYQPPLRPQEIFLALIIVLEAASTPAP